MPTPRGLAAVLVDGASGATTTLVLGHGAGGGAGAQDLAALAAALPVRGISVVRVEQPWRVAGKKVAPAPAVLDRAWIAVLQALAGSRLLSGRLVVGGRSAGARVACRTTSVVGAAAVVALAFPLHPPGRPERSRHGELVATGVPTLVVQGERDPFGVPSEFPGGPYHLVAVPGADHSFKVRRSDSVSQADALEAVVSSVAAFLAG